MRLTDGQAALIDRIATRAPVRQVLVIEAIGRTRVCRLAKSRKTRSQRRRGIC